MKKLQRASKDKDLRTFLFETAFQIYGDESAPEASDAGTPERKPKYVADLEEQVAGLRQERETEKTAAARHTYESQRTAELAALQREFPELKFDPARTDSSEYLRVADIIDRTETASQKAGRVLSYRDTYENMRKAWGATDKTAQRAIPQTTTRTETAPPRQAPMNDKDSRVRMRETINRHGGSLSTLAAALARGK
jgi:predicted P-loop ATPase